MLCDNQKGVTMKEGYITCVQPGVRCRAPPAGLSAAVVSQSWSFFLLFSPVRWHFIILPRSRESAVWEYTETGKRKRHLGTRKVRKRRRGKKTQVRPSPKCERTQNARLHCSVRSYGPCDGRKTSRHNIYI